MKTFLRGGACRVGERTLFCSPHTTGRSSLVGIFRQSETNINVSTPNLLSTTSTTLRPGTHIFARRGVKAAPSAAKETEMVEEMVEELVNAVDKTNKPGKINGATKSKSTQQYKAKKEEGINGEEAKKKGVKPKPFLQFPAATAFDKLKMPHSIFIDNSFLVHRAYHSVGLVGLKSTKGQPLGAVFGYTRAMLKLFADMKGDYVG